MKKKYSIFLISNKPEKYAKIQESLLPELLYYFDGSDATSFSQLVNRCVEASPTEIVIILGDKVLPKQEHIQKTVDLIEKGYGFVGLYRFGFFGFKKELLRRIGMFDERYFAGGWEDIDFTKRMILANIAFYATEEVEYNPGPSSWRGDLTASFHVTKWRPLWIERPEPGIPVFEKILPEEKYNYNLGPPTNDKFLTLREYTYAQGHGSNAVIVPFLLTKIISAVPLEFVNQ